MLNGDDDDEERFERKLIFSSEALCTSLLLRQIAVEI